MTQRIVPIVLLLVAGCATDSPLDPVDSGASNDAGAVRDGASRDVGTIDMGAADTGETIADAGGGGSDATRSDASTPSDMSQRMDASEDASHEDAGAPVEDMNAMVDMPNPGGAPETCATATDATGGGTFVDDTTGADDDYSAEVTADNCPSGAASGGDHVYRLAPAVETAYAITVVPEQTFDPFLYVKSDCMSSACVDGTVLNGEGVQESLNVTVPAGASYFVIVDGELFSEGEYTLDIVVQ